MADSGSRSRRWFLPIALIYAITMGVTLAQEQTLPLSTTGELRAGTPQTYPFSAEAGDLVSGTIRIDGFATDSSVTVSLVDDQGVQIRTRPILDSEVPLGFVTPKPGTYQLKIASNSSGRFALIARKEVIARRMVGVPLPDVRISTTSPRMAALRREAQSAPAAAAQRLWQEIETLGTPLMEALDGDPQAFLVTFLWRETFATYNVLVYLPTIGLGLTQDVYMAHVPGTDVWYTTVRVLRGSRLSYSFQPNYRPGEPRGWDGPTRQSDPLNRRSSVMFSSSVIETPEAPDESWSKGTPPRRGTLTPTRFKSALLKAERDIVVYTPPGYDPSLGPYHLMVFFDGPAYTRDTADEATDTLIRIGAPRIVDNLLAARRIHPVVMCFVSFTPNGTRAGDFQNPSYDDAIGKELVEQLRASYSISRNPKDVVIGGYSAGGATAARIALRHSEVFGNVLMQSGGNAGGLIPTYLTSPRFPIRVYQDVGVYEDTGSIRALRPGELPLNPAPTLAVTMQRRFRDVLEAKGYEVIYREVGGEHDDLHWRATLPEALLALLGVGK